MRTPSGFLRLSIALTLSMSFAFAQSQGDLRSSMLVNTDWLANHLNDRNVAVVQVGRDRAAYDSGHIPNARFLALTDIATTVNGVPNEIPAEDQLKQAFQRIGVGDGTRVILYDDTNGILASRAYFTLDYLGHGEHAALLDGGLPHWKQEGRPLSEQQPKVEAAIFTPHPRPDLIVKQADVQQLAQDKQSIIIDARPKDEYSGEKAGEGVPRAGHIPGAASVPSSSNIQSTTDPLMKSDAELQANYHKVGVDQSKRPVVYCRSGVQASQDYFALKMLGYKPVLYDGSFWEWSNAKDTKVEPEQKSTK